VLNYVLRLAVEEECEAANLAIKSGSVVNTATSLDIPVATLHTWVHDLKKKCKRSKVNADGGKDMSALEVALTVRHIGEEKREKIINVTMSQIRNIASQLEDEAT